MTITQLDSDYFTGFSAGFSHNLSVASGSNRFLVAILKSIGSGTLVFGSTSYNGVSMNIGPSATAVSFSNRTRSAVFWLPDASLPSSTGSYNLSWTFTGGGSLYSWEALVLVYSGVYQISLGSVGTNFSDNNTVSSYSTDITTIGSNSVLVDCLCANDSASAATPGGGQTEINDSFSSGTRFMVSSKNISTPQTTSMSWTFGSSTAQAHSITEILDENYSPSGNNFNSIFFGFSF